MKGQLDFFGALAQAPAPAVIAAPALAKAPELVHKPMPAPARVLDSMCQCVMDKNFSNAIPWWLMASYLYYHHDTPLLSDGLYDEMAQGMLNSWDGLEHRHKYLITREHLEAGSLYDLPASAYPNYTKYAAANLAQHELGVAIRVQ